MNRIPCSAINDEISKEVWKEKSIDLSYLYVFGSLVYVHDSGSNKAEQKGFKGC